MRDFLISLGVVVVSIVVAVGFLAGWPLYNVYTSRLAGEAELAKADFSKRIMVTTAQAKLDAAELDAQTDIRRAQGVSAANKILADSLGGPDGYLRWKYIEMLETAAEHGANTQTIYIPTEAALPILEAGKRGKQ